jgi:hypothetical protein
MNRVRISIVEQVDSPTQLHPQRHIVIRFVHPMDVAGELLARWRTWRLLRHVNALPAACFDGSLDRMIDGRQEE